MSSHYSRAGFTQLELLTVISVIALLAALLLPAVQYVRESSRLVQCRNHIRQLGAALHSFETVSGTIPPAVPATAMRPGGRTYSTHMYSPHVQLLPHLEQVNVYNQFDLRKPRGWVDSIDQLPDEAAHPIVVFRCPSDSSTGFRVNYRFCTGDQAHAIWGGGAFSEMRGLRFTAVQDGLSMTVAMSERVVSDDSHESFDRNEDFWVSHASRVPGFNVFDVDGMVRICGSLSTPPPTYMSRVGHHWLNASYAFTWYNHATTPNADVPDCTSGIPQMSNIPELLNSMVGVHKASSRHRGGVNVLYLDGSVRFVADAVDVTVWRASATIDGGEIISSTSI